jgi:hypothetical protein
MRFYFNIVLAIVGCLIFEADVLAQAQPSASQPDNEVPQLSSKPPPPGFATRWDYLKSFTNRGTYSMPTMQDCLIKMKACWL